MKVKKIIVLIVMVFVFSGCSLLKVASSPLLPTKTTAPLSTEKTSKREICKGEVKYDAHGDIISCSKGYSLNEKSYNKGERPLTAGEKLANIVRKMTGVAILAFIASVILSFCGFGIFVNRFWDKFFGLSRKGIKALVKGISNGKKYVRSNGYKFNDKEREAYIQGSEDMLTKIAEATKDKKLKKLINQYRADNEV